MQLLATALLWQKDKEPAQAIAAVNQKLKSLVPKYCDQEPANDPHSHSESAVIEIADQELSALPSGLAQRILYTLPWKLKEGEAYPVIDQDGTEVPLLTIRSALPIIEGDRRVTADWLTGRVVVIGASFEDSRDLHFTPLGRMPGQLVVINATRSLYQHGEITRPPWYVTLSIEAVLIVIMSLAFAVWHSFGGMLVSSLVIIVLLVPASFWFFKQAVWLDFALPLLAVQLHQMFDEFKEALRKTQQSTF